MQPRTPRDTVDLRKWFTLSPDGATICWAKRTPDMFPNSVEPAYHCEGWNARFAGKPVALTQRGRVRLHRREYAVARVRAALGGPVSVKDKIAPSDETLTRWQRSCAASPSPLPDALLRLAYYADATGVIRHRPRDAEAWVRLMHSAPSAETLERWNSRFSHAFVAFHRNRTALAGVSLHYSHIAQAVGAPYGHQPVGGVARQLPLPRDVLQCFFARDDAGRVVCRSLLDLSTRLVALIGAGVVEDITNEAAEWWGSHAQRRPLADLLATHGADAMPLYGVPVTLADAEAATA